MKGVMKSAIELNRPTKDGYSLLMLAVREQVIDETERNFKNGNDHSETEAYKFISRLLEKGAELNYVNPKTNQTALDVFYLCSQGNVYFDKATEGYKRRHNPLETLLLEHGAKTAKQLREIEPQVKEVKEKSDIVDANGDTPLLFAVRKQVWLAEKKYAEFGNAHMTITKKKWDANCTKDSTFYKIAEELLRMGADANYRNKKTGETALDIALNIESCDMPVAVLLIQSNAKTSKQLDAKSEQIVAVAGDEASKGTGFADKVSKKDVKGRG